MDREQKYERLDGYNYSQAISNVIKSAINNKVCISKRYLLVIAYITIMIAPCFGTGSTIICNSIEEDSDEQDITMIPPEISYEDIISAGIPEDCIPAKLFFNSDTIDYNKKWNMDILKKSCLYSEDQDFGSYYFFIVPTEKREDEMPLIDIWMYDANRKVGKLILHQTEDNDKFKNIIGIDWAYEISSHDSTAINSVSKEKYDVLKKTARPIVILSTADNIATVHISPSILILDVENGNSKFIKGQQFISLIKTDDRALMAAEVGLGKTYLISTSTIYKLKSENIRELSDEEYDKIGEDGNERVDIVDHNYLTPTVSIYSLEGNLIGNVTLPIDRIDTIR